MTASEKGAALSPDSGAGHAHSEGVGHVVPVTVLAGVLTALLLLTFLTVAATWVRFGALSVWIALLIATVKATFVGLYFMHLRYDRPFHGVVLLGTLFFISLFVGLALMDAFHYQPEVNNFREQKPTQVTPLLDVERARLEAEHPRPDAHK